MNSEDIEQERLFEALTIERSPEPAKAPPFGGFGGSHFRFRWPWHSGCPPLLGNQFDIAYRNKEGEYHRIYGPAYISNIYELEIWYKDGEYHRIDGPAVRHKNNVVYYVEGKLHRLDGAAVIEGGGPKQFWIEGRKYSPKEYKKEISRRKRKGKIK